MKSSMCSVEEARYISVCPKSASNDQEGFYVEDLSMRYQFKLTTFKESAIQNATKFSHPH